MINGLTLIDCCCEIELFWPSTTKMHERKPMSISLRFCGAAGTLTEPRYLMTTRSTIEHLPSALINRVPMRAAGAQSARK